MEKIPVTIEENEVVIEGRSFPPPWSRYGPWAGHEVGPDDADDEIGAARWNTGTTMKAVDEAMESRFEK